MTAIRLTRSESFGDEPMPSEPDAERAILGGVVMSQRNQAWFRLGGLSEPDLFSDANRLIFRTMAIMVEEAIPIDLMTLKVELERQGLLAMIPGGTAYIAALTDTVPDIANIERYVAIVLRASKKRAQIIAGNQLIRDGFDPTGEPEDAAAAAIASLGRVTTKEDAQARPLYEVLSEVYARQRDLRDRNVSIALTTGWPMLDSHKVFTPTLWVCGSPTKHGKSAWMGSMADGLARNGHPTAIFSLESTVTELSLRHTAMVTAIPHSRVRDWRTFSEADFSKVNDCHKLSARKPIYLTRAIRTAEDIALEIRRLKAVHGIQAAFVDYMQLVDLKRKVDSREERLAEIAKLLLEVAIDCEVTVMALSQLREGAGKDGARFSVDDLAYAKAIGKSARGVLLFHRPKKMDPNSEHSICHVAFSIEANNEDRTNDFTAHLDETTQRFTEGDCEHNDCRRLRATGPTTRPLFGGAAGSNT